MKSIFLIMLILAVCAGLLSGCRISVHSPIGLSSFYYDSAEKYAIGGAGIFDAVERVEIHWFSGSVTLILPEDTSMALSFHMVSGKLSSELPGKTDGKDSVFGDGTCACSIEMTSGDLRIQVNGSKEEDTK